MMIRCFMVVALSVLSAFPALAGTTPAAPPSASSSFTDAQKQEIQAIIKDYLVSNPAVMQESIEALQKHMQSEQSRKMEGAVRDNLDKLQNTAGLPVAGNPQGDVTVVEFFDYNCGYCKSVNAEVKALLAEDKNIRLVHREYPILSQVSKTAAEAALAANLQGKYLQMHDQLMGYTDHLSEEDIYRIAGEVGLDVTRLRTDMQSAAIQAEIASTRALADAISIRGTPAFVIGTNLYPGALDKSGLVAAVARARAEKSAPR